MPRTKRNAGSSRPVRDFLTKPLDRIELVLRVRNLLDVKQLQDRLREHNADLEYEVAERTRELDHARLEMLAHLSLAGEFRDDATQQHAWRIGGICALLVGALGLPEQEAELIERAAPLHDLGKIGISDMILLKADKLTDEEFELVKTHARIGGEILAGSRSPLLRLAERIALTHHERWDGRGYPAGLRGEAIPLAGRIAAVADVFDVLTHERPYKPPWPVEQAVAEIVGQAGRQFDPRVIAAFSTLDHHKLLSAARKLSVDAAGPHVRARFSTLA
jgi:putative two-component system response regulator